MMDEAPSSSSSLPPFIVKTYDMVDDPSIDTIVSWSRSNKSFIVWNPPEFARQLLPRFFKHNNFSSFIRQLNTYGFRKVDPEQWEFANDDFVRGQPHLLKNIHRRKPVHSHSSQNLSSLRSLTESERKEFNDDIERLKRDKESLHLELQRHKEAKQGLELQIRALTKRAQNIEQQHKAMLSSLSHTLRHDPAVNLDRVPPVEVHDRKRRFSDSFLLDEDNLEISSEMSIVEDITADSLLEFNRELSERLETSLNFWESIVVNVNEGLGQEKSTVHMDESVNCAPSPCISYTQLNIEGECGKSVTNLISKTASADQAVEMATNERAGANDVFWEQFLTENPGSNGLFESQSEKNDGKKNEKNGLNWLNMKSVNNLAEQLGHLAPAEST